MVGRYYTHQVVLLGRYYTHQTCDKVVVVGKYYTHQVVVVDDRYYTHQTCDEVVVVGRYFTHQTCDEVVVVGRYFTHQTCDEVVVVGRHEPHLLGLSQYLLQRDKAYTVKKRLLIFPYAARMSLTKLSLAENNLIIPGQGEFGFLQCIRTKDGSAS